MALNFHCTVAPSGEPCDAPEDCPLALDPCTRRVCREHLCGALPEPKGTLVPPSMTSDPEADCKRWYCDGEGGIACDNDARCGDGACDPGETCSTCAQDCGGCSSPCGDGLCDPDGGETSCECPQDCGPCCGDGYCSTEIGEVCESCPEDCCE